MGLDEDYSTNTKPEAKGPVSNAELAGAIRELNKSINQMIKIFEEANQELLDEYQGSKVQLKDKLDEISDQNEKIAQGLVGLADSLNKDGATPEPVQKEPSKTENNTSGFRWDTDIPELEKPPVQGQQVQPKHDFDLGFKDDELQEVSFNNRTGIKPAAAQPQAPAKTAQDWPTTPQPQKQPQDWQAPPAQQKDPWQNQQQTWGNQPAQDFDLNDPFGNQDPFAQQPSFNSPNEFSLPNPEEDFMPPIMPGTQKPQPMQPQNPQPQPGFQQYPPQGSPNPNPWDFSNQQFGQQPSQSFGPMTDMPPAVPEPPKKKGLFASLLKK